MSTLSLAWALLVVLWAAHVRPRPTARPGASPAGGPAASGTSRRTAPPAPSRAVRTVLLIGSAGAAGVLWPPLAAVVVASWFGVPRWRRARSNSRHAAAVRRGLPDVVDLLTVAVGAGLTPQLAIGHLAALAPPPFASALAEVDRRVARGQRLADALDALPEHLGDAARPLASTLATAERYGGPLAPALDVLAHDARHDRRRHAEAAARTLPVKLCFPLVCCTLPAFVLLTIAPLVVGAVGSLRVS